MPFFALASGFLSGKYRGEKCRLPGGQGGGREYLDERGMAALEALNDHRPGAHDVPVAAVALAWLLAHPRVVAPIASARTVEQFEQLLPAAGLELTPGELDRLSATTR